MTSSPATLYLPNLTSLRFIAALVVVITHVDVHRSFYGLNRSAWIEDLAGGRIGKLAVTLFFVLSGFLITYLLSAERNRTGRLDVKRFYARRLLRILPLYALTVILALFVLPEVTALHYPGYTAATKLPYRWEELLSYGLVAPNFTNALYGLRPGAGHLWSIGVEEQFYLFWPFLFVFAVGVQRLSAMIAVVLGYVVFNAVTTAFAEDYAVAYLAAAFAETTPISTMAIGGITAHLVWHYPRIRAALLDLRVFWTALFALGVSVVFSFAPFPVYYEYYALLFALVAVNLALHPRLSLALETPLLRRLGTWSYGIYMFHPFCIFAAGQLVGHHTGTTWQLLGYTLSIGLSIIVAGLSYHYFERPFLRFKERLQVVGSRA